MEAPDSAPLRISGFDGRKPIMARAGKLTSMKVASIVREAKPGYTGDGGGLYLQISRYGTPSWVFRYRVGGRLREAGLGSLDTWSLAEARTRARQMRQMRAEDIDPIDNRRAKRQQARLDAAKALTFKDCAERYIAAHEATWKNEVHRAQWRSTLENYVFPVFGSLPVQAVDTALVMKVIEPIWTTKAETASRVRGRIESVLDWAKAREWRQGENPARWRGHLDKLLPKPTKAKRAARQATGRGEHHAALPYPEIGAFMAELRGVDGIAARALEFAILTAARTGEVIGARWEEINITERAWTIPAERMKADKEHRVPLSNRAVEIVESMAAIRSGEFVFPGIRAGRPLSNMALLMTLRRMSRDNLTAHGFRSTFRDWAAERTGFPAEVAEMALAHAVGDKVEAAYRRGDLFQKRRQLAEAWTKFCAAPAPAGKVVPMRRAAE
ncbi:MAG TPA: integrase arm-type DNA-binding domain-containing protein [Stellaceae bacterium]|nr:integrase arm-type DNA-binding domain-containing protein [Stellaceae bacterium]